MEKINIQVKKETEKSDLIFADSTECIFLINPKTKVIIDCNLYALALFETENKKSLIGLRFEKLFKNIQKKEFKLNHKSGNKNLEFITLKKNIFWGELTVDDLELNHVDMVLVKVSDLSELKKAENELIRSPFFIHSIFSASPNSIYLYNIEKKKLIYSNNKLAKLLGYRPEEIKKMGSDYPYNLIHPSDKSRYLTNLKSYKSLDEKEIVENEYRIIDHDGNWHWITFRASVFAKNELDDPIQIIGTAQDITEKKKFEQENTRLSSFTIENPNPILECDFLGNITYINPATQSFMKNLHIEIEHFLPANHKEITHKLLKSDHDYQTTISIKNKCIQWIYHPIKATGFIHIYGLDITEQKATEDKLIHGAFHDTLTGLSNRALFLDRLGHTFARKKRRNNYLFAVLFLDFDRFKIINDSLGHLAGDELLIQISKRLEENIRPEDTVARMGGDEFTVLIDDIKSKDDAINVTERIKESFSKPFKIANSNIFITSSIGIAFSSNEGVNKADDMLRNADIAMYKAKIKGKNRYELFSKEMHTEAVNFLKMETELWKAYEKKEFRVYYQPIFNLETNEIISLEAFIRWQHPKRGLLTPDSFIQIAEESGLITHLDLWVLQEACEKVKNWQNKLKRSFSISVNLSSKNFLQLDFAQKVSSIVTKIGLDANCLKFELTERDIMDYREHITNVLTYLGKLNIEIQIDNFGSGYSSLSYLHKLPINALKVDQSFIHSIDYNLEIIKTMVSLANNLGIYLIAEGIETQKQLELLKSIKCKYGQGYLFNHPVPAEEVFSLFENREIE